MVGWRLREFQQAQGDNGGQQRGVLLSMGLQRVGHALATEQQQWLQRLKFVCFSNFLGDEAM